MFIDTGDADHELGMKRASAVLESLRGPVGEDRKDAERLDWLHEQSTKHGMIWFGCCGDDYRFIQLRYFGHDGVANYPLASNVRSAIDAAMIKDDKI